MPHYDTPDSLAADAYNPGMLFAGDIIHMKFDSDSDSDEPARQLRWTGEAGSHVPEDKKSKKAKEEKKMDIFEKRKLERYAELKKKH
jgi:hypothetical protein